MTRSYNFQGGESHGPRSIDYINDFEYTGSDNIVTGQYAGTLDFNPYSASPDTSVSKGGYDIFIHEISSYFYTPGRVYAVGGPFDDAGLAVVADWDASPTYVTGYFRDSVDFNNHPFIDYFLSSSGNLEPDAFLLRLSSYSSPFVWAMAFGSTGYDCGQAIAMDYNDNVIVAGVFSGTVDFDPGPQVRSLTSQGGKDFFLIKLRGNGELIWAKSFGSVGDEGNIKIVIDRHQNIVCAGNFGSAINDFDPGSDTLSLPFGGKKDVFLSKFDSTGTFLWSKSFGGSGHEFVSSISSDVFQNICVSGEFEEFANFGSPSNPHVLSDSLGNAFVQVLSPNGSLKWVKQFEALTSDTGSYHFNSSAVLDYNGFVLATGSFSKTINVNPGSDSVLITPKYDTGTYVVKFNPSGDYVHSFQLENTDSTGVIMSGPVKNRSSNTSPDWAIAGTFRGGIDGKDLLDTINLESTNGFDPYISEIKECVGLTQTITGIACDSFFHNGNVYNESGIYIDTVYILQTDCPSIYTLDITILSDTSFVDTVVACQSYFWPASGQEYFNTGVYSSVLPSSIGCDSTVFLYLTINPEYIHHETIIACDSFQSVFLDSTIYSSGFFADTLKTKQGCDSIFSLDLTILRDTVAIACDSFRWEISGEYYSSSGLYTEKYPGTPFCTDSLRLNLTINASNSIYEVLKGCDSMYLPPLDTIVFSEGIYIAYFTNQFGCDSIVSLEVDFTPSSDSTSIVSCDSFYWEGTGAYYYSDTMLKNTLIGSNGCDSSIVLDLEIKSSSFEVLFDTACYEYLSPGNSWINSSGIYFDTLSGLYGCDSVFQINLTILDSTSFSSYSETACDSMLSPSGSEYWKQSGIYSDTLINSIGCDSVLSVSLTINHSYRSVIQDTICFGDTIVLGSQILASSGLYSHNFFSNTGCDSIVIIDLFVKPETYGTLIAADCDTFLSPSGNHIWYQPGLYTDTLINHYGCDSILFVNLSFSNTNEFITTHSCDSFMAPSGTLFYRTGIYFDTIPSSLGCDSIIRIELNIPEIDTSLTRIGDTIWSNQDNATYQWLDCLNGFSPIPGETNRFIIGSPQDAYAVEIYHDSCIAISGCLSPIISAKKVLSGSKISFYPNPTSGKIIISNQSELQELFYEIFDFRGSTVSKGRVTGNSFELDVSTYSPGLYLISFRNGHINYKSTFIKR